MHHRHIQHYHSVSIITPSIITSILSILIYKHPHPRTSSASSSSLSSTSASSPSALKPPAPSSSSSNTLGISVSILIIMITIIITVIVIILSIINRVSREFFIIKDIIFLNPHFFIFSRYSSSASFHEESSYGREGFPPVTAGRRPVRPDRPIHYQPGSRSGRALTAPDRRTTTSPLMRCAKTLSSSRRRNHHSRRCHLHHNSRSA